MFLEGDVRPQPGLPGRLLRRRRRRRTAVLQRVPGRRRSPTGNNAGLGDLPFIFPDASLIDQRYFVYDLLERERIADVGRHARAAAADASRGATGSTNTPPNIGFPSQNVASSHDISISLTKVWGRHTIKTGFYNQHSNKQQVQGGGAGGPSLNFQQDAVGHQPVRHVVRVRQCGDRLLQLLLAGVEGRRRRVRLQQHRGVRPGQLEAEPQAHARLRRPVRASAAAVRQRAARRRTSSPTSGPRGGARCCMSPGCANGVYPCTGTNRQAMNPLTEPVPRPEHARWRSARSCPNSGNLTNGLVQAGQGIPDHDLHVAGAGRRAAVRHGLRPDRPPAASCCAAAAGSTSIGRAATPCSRRSSTRRRRRSVTIRYGQLQTLGHGRPGDRSAVVALGLRVRQPAAVVDAVERRHPARAAVVDRGRRRVRRSARLQHRRGRSTSTRSTSATAFLPQNQDPTLAPTTPGATSVPTDQMRAFRGYSGDHAERQPRVGHASLAAGLVQPPVPQRRVVRLQRHDRALERRQHRRAPAAQRRRLGHLPRRPGRGRRALPDAADAPHDEGQLRLGSAGSEERQAGAPRDRPRHQRLAVLGRLDGVDRPTPYTVGFNYQSGGGNREPDRLARLRRARPHRRRSGRGLQQRSSTASSTRRRSRARWSAASDSSPATTTCRDASRRCSTCRSRGTSGCRRAGTSSCASTCSTRRTGADHRAQHDDEAGEPDRSEHDHRT